MVEELVLQRDVENEKRHFKAISASSRSSFFTFLQNEASDAAVSTFTFNPSLVASSNNSFFNFIIKFKRHFGGGNGFWILVLLYSWQNNLKLSLVATWFYRAWLVGSWCHMQLTLQGQQHRTGQWEESASRVLGCCNHA